MSILITNFETTPTFLQGNRASFNFPLVTDKTVVYGYARNYRYRLLSTELYCDIDKEDNYIAYEGNRTNWVYSAWEYLSCTEEEIKNQIEENKIPQKEVSFTVPSYQYDMMIVVEIEVQDDGTGQYFSTSNPDNDANDTPPFIALYNGVPDFSLDTVERKADKDIGITITIRDTGIGKPRNLSNGLEFRNSAGWGAYYTNILKAFYKTEEDYITLSWQGSDTSSFVNTEQAVILKCTTNDINAWQSQTLSCEISVKDDSILRENKNTYFRLLLEYGNSEAADFKFAADKEDGTRYSSILLLPAAVSSFQIKRRGVKAHMLENDSALGTFSTGAGMFNHGEEVGVDVSGGTPKLDNSKGHSIALYDTRADGANASNKPSIGFMNDKHQALGYLRYDPSKGDRGALVSNLPIIGNNQEVDDDPSVNYTMSIGLVLGNGEIKTISFNGELS